MPGLVLALAAALAVVLSQPPPDQPSAPAIRPASLSAPRIMVVGDSISQGLEGDYTWRYRLKEHLSAAGVSSDFVGPWSGTTVIPSSPPAAGAIPSKTGAYRTGLAFADSQHLSQWGWQMAQAKWEIASNVSTYAPDYLLVELGFNDLGWGVSGPSGTLDSLRELVTNARAAKPDVRILVGNVVHRSALANNPDLPQKISDYNGLLPGFVSSVGTGTSPVALVDVDTPFTSGTDSYDGLHPNVRGEHVIARAFADTLASRFSLGSSYGAIPTSLPANLTPAAPTSVTVTPSGYSLKIAWPHSFGAGGYRLYKRDVTTGETFSPYPLDIGADSWTESIVPAGHQLAFYVRPVRGNTVGASSPTGAGTATALAEVANLRSSADPLRPYTATLTWDPVPGADDYHVYAAGSPNSCDVIPPSSSSFKLVQWSLGSKTTWTQEYVFDLCEWYYVVASRYGGEGPRQSVPVRVLPYENNVNHYYARNRFFDTAADDGDRRANMQVAAGPDRGVVVARGFIRNASTFTDIIGDHRQFESNPYASSKIGVAWDTKTGEVGVYVHRSCAVGSSFLWNAVNVACHNAFPIQFVSDATIYKDSNETKVNYVSVSKSGNNLTVAVSAINSWEGWNPTDFGRINAKIQLTASGSTYNVSMTGDKFPAWEFLRYPRTDGFPAGFTGTYRLLGTRDQTSLGDLKTAQSVCTSTSESNTSQLSQPMSCR